MGVLGAEGRGGIAANTQGRGEAELLEASVFPVMMDLVQDCESEVKLPATAGCVARPFSALRRA